jgi:hypothetical protein
MAKGLPCAKIASDDRVYRFTALAQRGDHPTSWAFELRRSG